MVNKSKFYLLFFLMVAIVLRYLFLVTASPRHITNSIWEIQSIDTMKFSRDLAREKLGDTSFDEVINSQVGLIAETGATHVAIGVPYDEEFLPFMRRWVNAARKNGLKIWFRGNLSGWEGWFGYQQIESQDHTKAIGDYILGNADLFEDGDLFSSCPECENGSLGDPRHNGKVVEYRQFLVSETDTVRQSFRKIGKEIMVNLHSMNGDVARLVMDKETTKRLGGFVVIDHYVATPEKLIHDIREIAESSGGKVILGEFGAPIPDIHGKMSESEQASWVNHALGLLAREKSVTGLNYWTGFGGSSKVWNDDGTKRQVASSLRGYFSPTQYKSQVVTWFGIPVGNTNISEEGRGSIITDNRGYFSLPIIENSYLTANKSGFSKYRSPIGTDLKIYLEPNNFFSLLSVFLFDK